MTFADPGTPQIQFLPRSRKVNQFQERLHSDVFLGKFTKHHKFDEMKFVRTCKSWPGARCGNIGVGVFARTIFSLFPGTQKCQKTPHFLFEAKVFSTSHCRGHSRQVGHFRVNFIQQKIFPLFPGTRKCPQLFTPRPQSDFWGS